MSVCLAKNVGIIDNVNSENKMQKAKTFWGFDAFTSCMDKVPCSVFILFHCFA